MKTVVIGGGGSFGGWGHWGGHWGGGDHNEEM